MCSGINVEKEENGEILVSCQAPCSEKVCDSKDHDAGLLNHGNGKELGPANPFADTEITGISSSSDKTEEEDTVLGCQTPTESIFDPFAPGPDDLMLAPKKKITRESKIPLCRQLKFDSSESMETAEANAHEDAAEDDHLLECI
ncbi:putative protein 1 [Cocos nucifera]|uniref:Uncharacterized protein n=1 Tax=Cocos nucifera TaxID=13894 RepID=A0A8K0I5G9_COCNU|nr:putative protein 1 [Cocos nucifera]